MRAEAHGDAERDHLDDAAEGVAGGLRGVYPRHDLPLGVWIQTAHRAAVCDFVEIPAEGRSMLRPYLRHDPAQLRYVRADFNAEFAQQFLAHRAARHTRHGFSRAGALQDIPRIRAVILEGSGEIGVAGARPRNLAAPALRIG